MDGLGIKDAREHRQLIDIETAMGGIVSTFLSGLSRPASDGPSVDQQRELPRVLGNGDVPPNSGWRRGAREDLSGDELDYPVFPLQYPWVKVSLPPEYHALLEWANP